MIVFSATSHKDYLALHNRWIADRWASNFKAFHHLRFRRSPLPLKAKEPGADGLWRGPKLWRSETPIIKQGDNLHMLPVVGRGAAIDPCRDPKPGKLCEAVPADIKGFEQHKEEQRQDKVGLEWAQILRKRYVGLLIAINQERWSTPLCCFHLNAILVCFCFGLKYIY